MEHNQQSISFRTLWLVRLVVISVLLLSALVLTGWLLDIPRFKSVLSGMVAMKANTAVGLALAALALGLLEARAGAPWRRRAAFGCALAVAALGAVTLLEYLLGTNLGIDQLLFREPAGAIGTSHLERMAPLTAVDFVLLGSALWLVTRPGTVLPAQLLALLTAISGFFSLIGYLYQAAGFYQIGVFTPIALPTAVAFVALGLGVLSVRSDTGLMTTITSTTAGGVVARRLLAVTVVLPVALGWLRLLGQRAGFYNTAFGLALTTIMTVVLLAAVIWWTALRLERAERLREQAQARLKFIFDSVPVGISFSEVGADGRIANMINDAHLRICGLTREQVQEPGIFKKITEPEDHKRQAVLGQKLDSGGGGSVHTG